MNYRGSMVLVRALDPGRAGAAVLDRIEAALMSLDPKRRPTTSSRAEDNRHYFRFRIRIPVTEGYRMVIRAAGPQRSLIDALVWIGPPGSTTYGDTSAMSRESIAKIAGGGKTTSYGSLADCVQDGEPVRLEKSLVTVLDHAGEPALVYQTIQVAILPFQQLPQAFDSSIKGVAAIASWQAHHKDYFGRIGAFDPVMPIVCERFRLLKVMSLPTDKRIA